MLFHLPTLGRDPRDPGVILTTILFSLPRDKSLPDRQIHLCSLFRFSWARLFSPETCLNASSAPVPSTQW